MRGKSSQMLALISVGMLLAGCAGQNLPSAPNLGAPTATPTVDPGTEIALPWDTSLSPSHEIMCAYDREGIVGQSVGETAACGNHMNGPSTSTQDQYALDFDLKAGETVVSASEGVVRWAGTYPNSSSWSCYGKSVAIDSEIGGFPVTEFYAHLQTIEVTAGHEAKKGQVIGLAGSSGGGTNSACPNAYGTHLHFATYYDAHYLGPDGKDVHGPEIAPADYWEAMSSPPYGGASKEPGPWQACTRRSALASPPAGGDSTCTKLHAGDILTATGGTAGAGSSAPGTSPDRTSETAELPGPVDVTLDEVVIATHEMYGPPAGYLDLLLRFAMTNKTTEPLPSNQSLNLGVTVVSGEGYKYEGGAISAPSSTIPAGFKIPVTVKVTVAKTAHHLRAVVASTDTSACAACSVEFPIADSLSTTSKPFAAVLPGPRTALGTPIVDGPVTYTVTSGYLATYCSNGIGGMIVNLKTAVQNDYGYTVQSSFDSTLFDAAGGSHRVEGAIRGAGGPDTVPPGINNTFSSDYEVGLNIDSCDSVPIYPPYVLVMHLHTFKAPDGSEAGAESWVIVDVPTPSVKCNLFEGPCDK